MRNFLSAALCALLAPLSFAQDRPFALMPVPVSVERHNGELRIDPTFSMAISADGDPRLERAVQRFLRNLRDQTGLAFLDTTLAEPASATLTIEAERAAGPTFTIGEDESYSLEVTPSAAKIVAPTSLGAMRGLQTFLQLVETVPAGFAVPAVTVHDSPRFAWRGLMVDVSRHFMPIEALKRNLDGMEALKLNVFHWHLSDNQGFRVESKKFPKLHERGSDGLYYTQDQVRELVEYANERGILVVPEFDMPGHSTAWFVGYPELSSGPGPYQIERRWGVFDPTMDPTREETYKFLDSFIGEMAGLFPGEYFHIGGDEVNGKQWDANPAIQQFKRAHGIKDNGALQAHFTARVQKIVHKHRKTMMGWDEVIDAEVPKDIIVHVWREQDRLASAVRQGFRGVFSFGYYLDLMWPASQHYAVDPFAGGAASLTAEEQKRVLGGEACMWSEYVSPEGLDARVWPRAAAIAERLWSPQNVRDTASMYGRLASISRWLEVRGLTHNSSYKTMLARIAGNNDVPGLRTLAEVVEPVKNYQRMHLALTEPTQATPLDRLVDVARPESETARKFAERVEAYLEGKDKQQAETEIRVLLTQWKDQRASVQSGAQGSSLLKEVVPVSETLSALGDMGLAALDYMDRGEPSTAEWRTQQSSVLQEAKKPKAQLLLSVVGPIQRLVEATATPPRR